MVIFPIDGANNVNEFMIGDAVKGEKLQMEIFAELQNVVLVVGATLETMFINDFYFIVDAELGEFLAHELGIFFGGAIGRGWRCSN